MRPQRAQLQSKTLQLEEKESLLNCQTHALIAKCDQLQNKPQ
jgi:hypothetical protein